ncbi:zinc-dependent alcohol dehydrogenase family protein [Nitrospina watsonii]|uniref:Bifunctional protein: zinc-containing alcohol dehydrogenase quinone oxidoreductase (NADPH:quinone reductase) Similar to arginate lyase n=1 Tax=Nitrospina watsonii TaxID=1323948 RepID=A0ABM9H9Q8_9BACT|nr:zinc-dependent alcohol dehydrogenase family protein [Nitrospina watsonii]CAI2716868.1 Bifunctional protein: zinc-containing alcohol dehydrogenase; quinone oxidoreductase (NADPH:quinone reductase); Similar to arginate lyase [Nitrospina watsonii]
MKAYRVHEYGESAQFVEDEVARPAVQPGHVLIETKATSLNPVDHKILTADLGINPELPAILHMDVAGVVVEVGAGVDDFQVGDEVYGCAGGLKGQAGNLNGALADFMLADANLIAKKPTTLGFAESAALPLVCITAWEGLFDRAKISQEDTLLVHAGVGGVGHIAIQLAKTRGLRVATTVSTQDKADIAKDLGADDVIFYRDENVPDYVQRLTGGKGFDVIFDTVGGDTLDKSLEAAAARGRVISIVGQSTHDLTNMHVKGLSLHLEFMLLPMITGERRADHGHILSVVARLADSGKLKPLLHEKRFRYAEANAAHALFASNQHTGKIVLENL